MKLKAIDLSVGYEDKVILSHVNFELNSGDFVIIIGKNGAGKSTLLKTLGNIIPLQSGKIEIDEMDYSKLTGTQKAKQISIVLTDKIDLPLSVKEVLQLGRQVHSNRFDKLSNEDYKIINQVVNELNLEGFLAKPINQLSDGERQKVMIAKALVQQSSILLLDEPTTHLDIENKSILLNLLKKISHEQNKIVVLSTHDINLILPMANTIWVIDNNKLIGINQKDDHSDQLDELFNNKLIKYDKKCHMFRMI